LPLACTRNQLFGCQRASSVLCVFCYLSLLSEATKKQR
jgi:hypothetical protein